jgi:hypothetical protein
MKKSIIAVMLAGVVAYALLVAGCNKKDDNAGDQVTDYMNLQQGKYVIYRLDSMTFIDRGQRDTISSYQAKDLVAGTVTDNLGRSGWRIVRYLRDVNSTDESDWKTSFTYQVFPTRGNLEVIESGLRYLKMIYPIKEGVTWKGNTYLPDNPYVDQYPFSNDEDIQTWDYTYQDAGASVTLGNKNYDNTVSVLQAADSTNLPIQAGIPASKTYWIEKYARNIGLIYKEVEIWEYQPATSTQSAYRQGFGIKMTILDHN